MEKNYSLLRPFDLEAAKRGEAICYTGGAHANYIAGPDANNTVVVTWNDNIIRMTVRNHLRMAPLCWVEGRPVYRGDVLYSNDTFKDPHRVDRVSDRKAWMDSSEPEDNGYIYVDDLTWTPPKVKREGWVNIYAPSLTPGRAANVSHAFKTEEDANNANAHNPARIACVRIEWEEEGQSFL